jgi:ABC-type uncharacterized transport system ATPase subunit
MLVNGGTVRFPDLSFADSNGAGKTTTMSSLMGVPAPQSRDGKSK